MSNVMTPVHEFAAYQVVDAEPVPVEPEAASGGEAGAEATPAEGAIVIPPSPTQLRQVKGTPLRDVVEVTPQELAAMLSALSRAGALGSVIPIAGGEGAPTQVVVGELVGMALVEMGGGIVPGVMAPTPGTRGRGGHA